MKNHDFKSHTKRQLIFVLIVSLLLIGQVWVQYKIKKHSINNGGGVSTNSNYQVTGNIGHKEVNNASSGGRFKVTGGF